MKFHFSKRLSPFIVFGAVLWLLSVLMLTGGAQAQTPANPLIQPFEDYLIYVWDGSLKASNLASGEVTDINISPDIMSSFIDRNSYDVYDINTSPLINHPADNYGFHHGVWSSDRSRFAHIELQSGGPAYRIQLLDNSQQRTLFSGIIDSTRGYLVPLGWTSDGNILLIERYILDSLNNVNIWKLNSSSGILETHASFSVPATLYGKSAVLPNGNEAFIGVEIGTNQAYSFNFADGTLRQSPVTIELRDPLVPATNLNALGIPTESHSVNSLPVMGVLSGSILQSFIDNDSNLQADPSNADNRPAPFLYWPLDDNERTIVNYLDSLWTIFNGRTYYARHHGTDIGGAQGLPEGTNVYAAARGIVVRASNTCPNHTSWYDRQSPPPQNCLDSTWGEDNWGNSILLSHPLTINGENRTYYTGYAHLMQDGIRVILGQEVALGTLIGLSGHTGNGFGPHLHFEVRSANNYRSYDDPWGSADLPHGASLWVGGNNHPTSAVNGTPSPPPNDLVENPIPIDPLPYNALHETISATALPTDPALPACLGGNERDYNQTIWFRYTAPPSLPPGGRWIQFKAETTNANFDPFMAVFAGQPTAASVPLVCNDDFGGSDDALVGLQMQQPGQQYWVMIGKRGLTALQEEAPIRLKVNTLGIISPVGLITNGYGNPKYAWNHTPGAPFYYIYVQNAASEVVINILVSAEAAHCNEDLLNTAPFTCYYDPTTWSENFRLRPGEYRFWVGVWNSADSHGQAGPSLFTLTSPPPGLVTMRPATDTGEYRPTIRWELQDSAADATAFNIYVGLASNVYSGAFYSANISRIQACGSAISTLCSFLAPVDLANGIAYSAFVQSIGIGGFLDTGGPYGNGYAGTDTFTVLVNTPAIPTNLQVDFADGLPIIRWDDVSEATHFELFIGRHPNWARMLFDPYPRTTGANGLCNNGICEVDFRLARFPNKPLLVNGRYNFAVRALRNGIPSQGGQYQNGWRGLENQLLNLPMPTAPTGFSPALNSTLSTGFITFSWDTVNNASAYRLLIYSTVPYTEYEISSAWDWAAEPLCTPHPGRCSIELPHYFVGGRYGWDVEVYGPGGYRTRAFPQYGITFYTAATHPGLIGLIEPGGENIYENLPTLRWADDSKSDQYRVAIAAVPTNPTEPLNIFYLELHRATRSGSAPLCTGGICELTVANLNLSAGTYAWNVQGISTAGEGPWNPPPYETFSIIYLLPGVPQLLSPLDDSVVYTTSQPNFVWEQRSNATYYQILLIDGSGIVVHQRWYSSEPICNSNTATCTLQAPNPLSYQGYEWRVQTYGRAGYSAWSPSYNFFVLVNPNPIVVQSNSDLVQSSGLWELVASDSAFEEAYSLSSAEVGDALELTFIGTQVDMIFITSPEYGSLNVEIDGQITQTVNLSTEQVRYGQIITINGLAYGEHHLRLISLGGAPIAIDALVVDGSVITQTLPVTIMPTITPLPTTVEPTSTPVPPTLEPTMTPLPVSPESTATQPEPENTEAP